MPNEEADIDQAKSQYHDAVEAWVAAIRREEALAASTESVADLDSWEEAGDTEEKARDQVKDAKKAYENALRQKFFNF